MSKTVQLDGDEERETQRVTFFITIIRCMLRAFTTDK